MPLDKEAFRNDLLEAMVCREYSDRYGVMEWDFRGKAVEKYRNDPVFHARVSYAVAHIMSIVDKHFK